MLLQVALYVFRAETVPEPCRNRESLKAHLIWLHGYLIADSKRAGSLYHRVIELDLVHTTRINILLDEQGLVDNKNEGFTSGMR